MIALGLAALTFYAIVGAAVYTLALIWWRDHLGFFPWSALEEKPPSDLTMGQGPPITTALEKKS